MTAEKKSLRNVVVCVALTRQNAAESLRSFRYDTDITSI